MRTSLHAGIVLVSSLALSALPQAAWGQHGHHRHDRAGAQPSGQLAQAAPAPKPAQAAGPSGDRPRAAIRVECSEGVTPPLCAVIEAAAGESAGRIYQIVEQEKVEAVLTREPALRGCRREDCRVAIADQLGAAKLIDVSAQLRNRRLVGTVSIYDPVAKGISGDTELQSDRIGSDHRDEARVRRAVFDTVDYVIGSQKLTATLRLRVEPEGARVKIDGSDRGTVREVRLFLGTHTVRTEKVGYIPGEQTVNVTPAGAQLEVILQPQPVRVPIKWFPPDARVLVDGDPVDARDGVVELVAGKHQVQALASPGSGYDSRQIEIEAVTGMPPLMIVLPRLAQLGIRAPAGYAVRVDNNLLPPGEPVSRNARQNLTMVSPGTHSITATSWRGRLRGTTGLAVPDRRTDLVLDPPSLAPGIVFMTLGALAIAGGAVALTYDGTCVEDVTAQSPVCAHLVDSANASYVTLGVGGAALLTGIIWFAVNAVDHPAFHHEPGPRKVASLPRITLTPAGGPSGGRLMLEGRF